MSSEIPTLVKRELRARRKSASGPRIVLYWTVMSTTQEQVCGNFRRSRRWHIESEGIERDELNGVVVQKVTRKFAVRSYTSSGTWADLKAGTIDAYIGDPDYRTYDHVLTYWEAWKVRRGEVLGTDTFGLCSIIPGGAKCTNYKNTTRGEYTISGEASLYLGVDYDSLSGFAVQSDHPAGDAKSSNSDPGLTGGIAARDGVFTITVEWNSENNPDPITTYV